LCGLLRRARDRLAGGESALDLACWVVGQMELENRFIAGRGSHPNAAGLYELDAAVMDGATRRAGAVAGLIGYRSAVAAARAVMDHTRHVMIGAAGHTILGAQAGLEPVGDPAAWFMPTTSQADPASAATPDAQDHGTVGCLVLDAQGRLAAATSTGGTAGKHPGRIGDTPLIGNGCWADARTAVLGTGVGEYFIRTAAAHQVAKRAEWTGATLPQAVDATLREISDLGGSGGLIALGAGGTLARGSINVGMLTGWVVGDGAPEATNWPEGAAG